ncbi:AKP8L protein, partial [Pachyramphus minor]|nr:AKP8L protein [Pachyramphus minor]
GYEGYNYGYGYGQDNSGGYGYGMPAGNSWDMGNSDAADAPESGDGLGKMNQRLELGSHPDSEGMPGGRYGAVGDRYDPYESYDSRSSLNDRDLYRPGYDYGDYGDYNNDYNNDYNDYNDYNNDY